MAHRLSSHHHRLIIRGWSRCVVIVETKEDRANKYNRNKKKEKNNYYWPSDMYCHLALVIRRSMVCRWSIVVVETKKEEPNKHISIIEMKEKEKILTIGPNDGPRHPPFVIPSFVDGVL